MCSIVQKSTKNDHSECWRQITPNAELAHKFYLPSQFSSTCCSSLEEQTEQESQVLPRFSWKQPDLLLISDSSTSETAVGLSFTHF